MLLIKIWGTLHFLNLFISCILGLWVYGFALMGVGDFIFSFPITVESMRTFEGLLFGFLIHV